MAELVDALGLGSSRRTPVRVRVPLAAHKLHSFSVISVITTLLIADYHIIQIIYLLMDAQCRSRIPGNLMNNISTDLCKKDS